MARLLAVVSFGIIFPLSCLAGCLCLARFHAPFTAFLWFLALLGGTPKAAQWPRQRVLQFRQVGPSQQVWGTPALITQQWGHTELQPCGSTVRCPLPTPFIAQGCETPLAGSQPSSDRGGNPAPRWKSISVPAAAPCISASPNPDLQKQVQFCISRVG